MFPPESLLVGVVAGVFGCCYVEMLEPLVASPGCCSSREPVGEERRKGRGRRGEMDGAAGCRHLPACFAGWREGRIERERTGRGTEKKRERGKEKGREKREGDKGEEKGTRRPAAAGWPGKKKRGRRRERGRGAGG